MIRIEYLSHGIKAYLFQPTKKWALETAKKLSNLQWVSDIRIIDDQEEESK